MAYKLKINPKTSEQIIIRLVDKARISVDEQNSDYKNFLAWQAQGNVPLPPDPEVKPPKLSAREKLAELGLDLKELKKLLKDTPEA